MGFSVWRRGPDRSRSPTCGLASRQRKRSLQAGGLQDSLRFGRAPQRESGFLQAGIGSGAAFCDLWIRALLHASQIFLPAGERLEKRAAEAGKRSRPVVAAESATARSSWGEVRCGNPPCSSAGHARISRFVLSGSEGRGGIRKRRDCKSRSAESGLFASAESERAPSVFGLGFERAVDVLRVRTPGQPFRF